MSPKFDKSFVPKRENEHILLFVRKKPNKRINHKSHSKLHESFTRNDIILLDVKYTFASYLVSILASATVSVHGKVLLL